EIDGRDREARRDEPGPRPRQERCTAREEDEREIQDARRVTDAVRRTAREVRLPRAAPPCPRERRERDGGRDRARERDPARCGERTERTEQEERIRRDVEGGAARRARPERARETAVEEIAHARDAGDAERDDRRVVERQREERPEDEAAARE